MRYLDLADALRADIAAGTVGALPSEAELGERHEVSACDRPPRARAAAGRGSRREPTRIGLVRGERPGPPTARSGHHHRGRARGRRRRRPSGGCSSSASSPPAADIAKALGLAADAEVLRVVRLNLADGAPFALVTVWLPETLGAHVSRADVERATFYDLLPLHGVETGRIVQTITATAADRAEARRLAGRTGDPLLACRRVTYDRSGAAVMVSEHRYPAGSTALEVEFPAPHRTGVSHG